MIKRIVLASAVLFLFMVTCGCFELRDNADYPAARFQDVVKKMEAIQAKAPGKRGEPTSINLMIYVGEERKMISLSTPVATLDSMINLIGNEGIQKGLSKNVGADELEAIKSINLKELKDKVLALGPCILVEVEVKEKDEFVHILIWME